MCGRVAASIAACLLLAGCAGVPAVPFDKSSGGTKTIGILTIAMPPKPNIWLASDPGMSLGLVGALVDAGLQESRNDTVWTMLQDRKVDPQMDFLHAVEASLQAHGYAVREVPVERYGLKFMKKYPPPKDTNVDAYLDISFGKIGYGYVAAGIGASTPYRPFAVMKCRLVRSSDGVMLMQDTIVYGAAAASGVQAVTISPDATYMFPDFDAMERDPEKTVHGIGAALHGAADAIGGLVR